MERTILINCDVKGLELVVAAQLSGDKVLSQEIRDKFDTHADNQVKFNLSNRVTAKAFVFKLLFGGTDYGYSIDPSFLHLGFSKKQWAEVIEKFYAKYYGIAEWHKQIIAEATQNKRLTIPSGRYYPFTPEQRGYELSWPITKIKNYPVQGFGADLVMLARLEARKLIRLSGVEALLVSTIHDSIVVDTPKENLDVVARILLQAVESVPKLCKQIWNYDFYLPLTAEVQYGSNKKDMEEYLFT